MRSVHVLGPVVWRPSASMHRVRRSRPVVSLVVRWCVTALLVLSSTSFCSFARADCWYDGEKYEEGYEVTTVEPCLNCTCTKGALLCYLRVCPNLPNPPPPGCILLHRFRTCCPELICPDVPSGGNALEARSEPDNSNIEVTLDKTVLGNACFANGTIYGPGSAMDSSTFCEYCYCLGGKQTCVKPKCLLPIEGCIPMYEATNCCPVHYKCERLQEITSTSTSSTTTARTVNIAKKGGCYVNGEYYPEGGKVLGVGHSVCDNCYCLRGLLRCEPLSCAPPLLGCTPVVRSGECCAASYNCSGTIEIQPEPTYGLFPTVSKEYAKLRKQVQQKPTNRKEDATEDTNGPYYVIAESSQNKLQQRSTFGTTRHFTGQSFNPSTSKPFYYNTMIKESGSTNGNKHSTRSYPENKYSGLYFATTNYKFQDTNYKRPYSTTSNPSSSNLKDTSNLDYNDEQLRSSDYLGLSDESLLSIVDSLLDDRSIRKAENETNPTTIINEMFTTEDITSTDTAKDAVTETDLTTMTEISTTENSNKLDPITVKSVLNTTDCIKNNDTHVHGSNLIEVTTILPVDANEINKLAELKTIDDTTTTELSDYSTEVTTANDDVTEVDLESRVKVASVTYRSNVADLPAEIESILNITKNKEAEYDYDYNEPSLPPSLPNLRIIPFVAADALDSKKQISKENNEIYPQERISDAGFAYKNLFSPPIKTEGGFVPKEPPILESFYENAVTASSITTKMNEYCTASDGRKIVHGQSVPSDSSCTTCTCFYGNIVCQKTPCPIQRPGCRKSTVHDLTLCCPVYVCDDEESPTVVLDRLEGISNSKEIVTVADGVVTPDPFRDVIRTEPAPDLQSLIVDMMPFLSKKTTPILPEISTESLANITTTTADEESLQKNKTKDADDDESLTLDKVLELLFSPEKTEKNVETTTKYTTTVTFIKPTSTLPSSTSKMNLFKTSTEYIKETQKPNSKNKPSNSINSVEPSPGVGILKLAGCNIYGRMYRVGRIISELSGPCLECKCTEVGVQCRPLKC